MSNANSDSMHGDLARTAAAGGFVTLGGQVLRLLVQLTGIVVLARLILPEDFGLLVMVTAIIGVGEVLRDVGLSAGSIQSKVLTNAQRDNLFWVNVGVGGLLTASVYALAVPISNLYGEPRLVEITRILSVTFILSGAATQYRAQLARNMRFGSLAGVEILGQVAGLGTAVLLALNGAGYWALVWQQVGQVVTLATMAVVVSNWRPGLPNRTGSIGPIVRFGWPLMATQLLGYASRNIDSFVIGLRFDPASLGIYNRAFQLLMMPLNQINAPATTVALPVLSRLQDEPDQFRIYLLRGQSVLMNASGLVVAWCVATAVPVVDIALGNSWRGVAGIFQILGIGGIFQIAGYASYWCFLALGLTVSNLKFAMASRPLVIGLIVVGSQAGLLGVAVGYSAGLASIWLWGLWWLRNVSMAPVQGMLRGGVRAVVLYLALAAAGAAIVQSTPDSSSLLRVVYATLLMGVLLMMGILLILPVRQDYRRMLRVARLGLRRSNL